jgi:hypothetical protein
MPSDDPCLTPGFTHRGDHRPMHEFYQVPADPSAPPDACCLRAVVVRWFELTVITDCALHGQRSGGNAD